jgi:hypothetical protein
VSAKSIGKTSFLGVAWPPDAKLTAIRIAGNSVGQNRAKLLPNEAVCSKRRVGIGEAKRKFRLKFPRTVAPRRGYSATKQSARYTRRVEERE